MLRGLKMDWWVILLTALAAFMGGVGQLEFKRGADVLEFDIKLLLTNYHLLIGLAVYAASTVLYIYSLSRGPLSVLYPVIATSYIWTTLFAKAVLNEPVGPANWIGIFFILLGVTLIVAQWGG
jgi:drug/metabolite transporter (DMT)-like permease